MFQFFDWKTAVHLNSKVFKITHTAYIRKVKDPYPQSWTSKVGIGLLIFSLDDIATENSTERKLFFNQVIISWFVEVKWFCNWIMKRIDKEWKKAKKKESSFTTKIMREKKEKRWFKRKIDKRKLLIHNSMMWLLDRS